LGQSKHNLPDEKGLFESSDIPIETDQPSSAALKSLREAAVLLPLVRHLDQWHILYIRRASSERDRHSGQVAFPGGARDHSDESIQHTALRETFEEIGVQQERIAVLGQLTPYTTISNFAVTAVVGTIDWPTKLTLQAEEVARTFLIPISWLQNRDNFTLKPRSEIDTASTKRHPIVVYEPYDGEILWGATARMTLNFFKALQDGSIHFPD